MKNKEELKNKVKKQIKKYESGVNQVAKSTNSMNVERRLHQQNGTWGALSAIPLVGGVMSNSLNYLQGKGKSEYARNEEIANMKMDRLSGQAQQMQEGFRTQGMRNSITNSQFGNQDMNDLYANMNNKAKHGKSGMKDKALIEVEKDELIFRPNGKGYKLVADMVGGKSHEQGGEPIVAKEGDVIFPGKQRKQVSSLLSPDGSVADLQTFEALRSRLPKDKPSDVLKGQMQAKATGGRIDGTGMDVREAFRKGCYAKKYEDGTAGVETDIKKLKSQLLVHKANGNTYEANKITKQIQILEEAKRKELAQTKLNSQAKREADYTLKQKIEAENKARIKASASSMMEGTPKTKTMRDVIASKVVPKLQEDDALRAKRANPTIQPGKYEVSDVATRARNLKEIESTVEEYRSKLRDPKTSVAERKAINEVLKGLEEDMKKYNPLTSDELKELELKKQALASNRGKTTGSLKENVKRELILNQRSKTVEEALEAMKKPYTPPSGTPISSPRVSPSILSKVKSALPSGKNLGKAGIVAGIAGLGYGLYNTLTSDDTPIEKVKKSGKLVGEALTSAAIPGDSGVVDVKLDTLNKKKQSLEKDTLLYKNDPKALSQLRTELDTVNKKIKALGGDTSSTIQHSRRTQSVIDSLETTPSDTSRTKQKPANRQLSNYVPDSTGSDALEEQYRKEDEQVSRSSSPSSYSPPPRYSELHTKGVKRGGVQLEPTDAEVKANRVENTHMRDDKGNTPLSMAEYKRNKVKELRDKKVDLSDYESPTGDDLETFYNVYHDKKHSPETKKKIANDKLIEDDRRATELWKQISTEGAKPSITKPKPMEVDEDSKPPKIYQDEELPEWNPKKRIPEGEQKPTNIKSVPIKTEGKFIDKDNPPIPIKQLSEEEYEKIRRKKAMDGFNRSKVEYSKGTSSVKHGMEHERKEMKNVSAIQKKLNILKGMHSNIPKAEYGVRGVQGNMGGNLHNMGYQSPNDPTQQTMSTDSSMMPTPVKRQVPPMQGIKPMSVPAYTPPPITPTMPTLDEPKGSNPARGLINKFKQTGGRGFGIDNWDSGGFNMAVGQSRARGDRYTDKYTATAGGANTNQYKKGSKKLVLPKYGDGKKGKQVQQGNVGGGGVAPIVKVEQGRISTKSILGKDHKLGSAPTTFSSTRPTDEQILRDQRAVALARGIGDKFDAWLKQTTPSQAANDIWTKPGHNFGQGFTPDIKTEVVKEPDTTTVVPSGAGALGQSQSSVDQGVNNNSKALTQELGHTVQNQTYADFEGADFSQEAMTKEEAEARKRAGIKGGRFQLRSDKRDKRAFNEAYEASYKGYKREGLSHSQAEEKALAHAQSRLGGGDKKDFTALGKNAFEGTERKAPTFNVGNTTIGDTKVDNSQGQIGNNDSSSSVEGDTKNTKDSGNSPSTKISSKDDNSLKVDVNAPTDVNAPVVLHDGSTKPTTPTTTPTTTSSTTTSETSTYTNGVNSNAVGDITAPNNSVSDKIEKDTEGNKLEKKKRGTRKLVLNKYRIGTEDVKTNGSATGSGTNSNSAGTVNAPSTSTSGPVHKTTTGGSFVVHKTPKPKPEDEVKPGKPEETKPSKPIDVGDFKMPKWKTPRDKNDPAVSPDDVTAVKTNLYRNNYQDLSAAQRQQTHSLMSGGGFDSGNQIANKVNKSQALDQINTAEAGRLAAVNESNTAILNTEKQLNMGNQIASMNARDENKGVADAVNYNAVLRNNQRANDKEMKDMNLNMGRMQYAMAGPMMQMQMENQRLANEYMKKGPTTPTPYSPTPPPPTPSPSTPGLGWNANPTNSPVQQANSSNALGMGPNPSANAGGTTAPTINGSNFLQQTGFVVPRKGTRKLRVKRDSNISKVPLR